MVRVLMAGIVGGVVLVLWGAVFAAVGPTDGRAGPQSALASVVQQHAGELREFIPLGPSEAHAAEPAQAGQAPRPEVMQASLDPFAVVQGLGVACAAATLAAFLMSMASGKNKAFAERVVVAVLLGVFASCAMLIPAGRWAEFSMQQAAPLVGEAVVGWLLAGMVMAVVLRPQPRKARA